MNHRNLLRPSNLLYLVLVLFLFVGCQPDDDDQPVIPDYSQPFLGAWKIKESFSTYTINIAREPGMPNSIIITNLDDDGSNTRAQVDGSTFVIPEQDFSGEYINGSGSVRSDTLTVIFNTKFTASSSIPTSHTAVGLRR